jgi:hypothetical protein
MILPEELPATPEERKKAARTLWMFGAGLVLCILFLMFISSL